MAFTFKLCEPADSGKDHATLPAWLEEHLCRVNSNNSEDGKQPQEGARVICRQLRVFAVLGTVDFSLFLSESRMSNECAGTYENVSKCSESSDA